MKASNIKDVRLGISSALFSGITWGIDTVLLGIILAKSPFIDTEKAIVFAPFVSTFLHDAFSAIWITLFQIVRGDFKNVIRALRTKSGLFIVLGALLGGPVGMTCYTLSVKYIGPAYAASITSIYPAAGAFFAFLFLKEKLEKRVWMGISLSVIGVILIGYTSAGNISMKAGFALGLICALGTVLGWGLESVICAYGMKEDVTSEQALNIRQLTSAIFYGVIILPLIGGHEVTRSVFSNFSIVYLAITALVGSISYLFYYSAINIIGAARSTALNITYAMWAILIQIVFLKQPVTPQFVLGSLIILSGTILVAGNPKAMLNLEA
ncbi:DMT family transporter [Clostridium sp.]|uniref:DMT family transporter n=1 Tax=Clostridium sp. TaxID=1506 RepID=UPI003463B307